MAEARVPPRRLQAPDKRCAPIPAEGDLGAGVPVSPLLSLHWASPRHPQPGLWPPAAAHVPSSTRKGPDTRHSRACFSGGLWALRSGCCGRHGFSCFSSGGPGSAFSGPFVSTPGPNPPLRRAVEATLSENEQFPPGEACLSRVAPQQARQASFPCGWRGLGVYDGSKSLIVASEIGKYSRKRLGHVSRS